LRRVIQHDVGDQVAGLNRKIINAGGQVQTDVDIITKNRRFIEVGGPAKANKPNAPEQLKRLKQFADSQGGVAQMFYDAATPESYRRLAESILGAQNVRQIAQGL
jgi:hypothetical protein